MTTPVTDLSAAAGLRISLLGGFEARLTNGRVADLSGRKDRALLAYLAVAGDGPYSREHLAGLLWSERSDHQARNSLKQTLLRLRRGLADNRDLLRADRHSIALDRTGVEIDVLTLERLVRDDTIDALTQATAIYRGELLEGMTIHDPAFEDWLMLERQRIHQLCARALARLTVLALDAAEWERAAEAARRLLLLDPLNEAAYRALMRIHGDNGETTQALKLYDHLSHRLHRELGVQPEPGTVALHEQIRQRRSSAPASAKADVEPPDTRPSVAVLPFLNLGGNPEEQYFSDGVTEDIITELSRFRTLFVVGRSSSFRYRDGDRGVIDAARALGLRYLVEGSVRRVGDRLRICAQLIDAATGSHLWAEQYDRAGTDILMVQDDIVRAIATTLGYRVEAAGRARALRLSPEALSAYDLTLRSEALFLRDSKEDNAEAQKLAKRAVELDPRSTMAHTRLGWTYWLNYFFGWVEECGEPLATALTLAQRAVLLDDADCRARWLLGYVHILRREFDEADAHLRTALMLNPNDVEARGVYGVYLTCIGESGAAIDQFDAAKRRNPFEFNWVITCRGAALFTAKRYDEAVAALKQVHNMNNEVRLWLAASLAAVGNDAEAQANLAAFLTVAERDMERFPGHRLDDWQLYLRRFVEYRDPREFDHLSAALSKAGLE